MYVLSEVGQKVRKTIHDNKIKNNNIEEYAW